MKKIEGVESTHYQGKQKKKMYQKDLAFESPIGRESANSRTATHAFAWYSYALRELKVRNDGYILVSCRATRAAIFKIVP